MLKLVTFRFILSYSYVNNGLWAYVQSNKLAKTQFFKKFVWTNVNFETCSCGERAFLPSNFNLKGGTSCLWSTDVDIHKYCLEIKRRNGKIIIRIEQAVVAVGAKIISLLPRQHKRTLLKKITKVKLSWADNLYLVLLYVYIRNNTTLVPNDYLLQHYLFGLTSFSR